MSGKLFQISTSLERKREEDEKDIPNLFFLSLFVFQ
jgi:hypothetical protein